MVWHSLTGRLLNLRDGLPIHSEMKRESSRRLLRSWKERDARFNGYLEDYAYLIEAQLKLYQTTFESRWFVAAQDLAETMAATIVWG